MKTKLISALTAIIMLIGISSVWAADESEQNTVTSIFDGIEAKNASDVKNCYISGSAIGGTNSASYAIFENVDFGTTGLASLSVNIGTESTYAGGKVRFHLDDKDSAPFAELTVASTGSFGVYKWQEMTLLDPNISGVNTVCVTFSANATGNLAGFKAVAKESSSLDISVPEAVAEAGIEKEYLILTALDILEYDKENAFDPSKQVIASDFAKAALMMTGETEDYAVENLVSVCDLKSGEAINAEKACEMLIKLLNRQMLLLDGKSYYEAAREWGIKCKTAADYPLDWENAVKLLYGATDVAPVEIKSVYREDDVLKADYTARENNTLLLQYRNIRKAKGILTMDSITGLKNVNDIGEYRVLIDDYIFDVGDCDVTGLLGYEIEYYFESGDFEDTLLYARKTDKNYVMNFEASEIEEFRNGSIEYIKDKKTRTVKIPTNAAVIYNGIAVSKYDSTMFNITDGNIELISNNHDEVIDVVKIWQTEDYLYAGSLDNKFYFKNTDYTIDYEASNIKLSLMSKEGLVMSMSRLSENQVFTVSEAKTMDDSLTVYNIWVTSKPVSGSVKAMSRDGRTIKIADKEYSMSGDFAKNRSSGIAVGMELKFFMNKYGQVAFTESNVISDKVGYLIKVYRDEDDEDIVYAKIFGEDGVTTTYKCYEKITIDGNKKTTGNQIYTYLTGKNDLCVFSTNARGEINKLNFGKSNQTELGKTNPDKANGLYFYLDTGSAGLVYRPESRSMGGKIIIANDFKTFMIPRNLSEYEKSYIRTSNYTYTYIKNLKCYNTKFDAFDANYGVMIFETTTENISIDNESEICYISDVSEEWNGSETEIKIGYYGNDGKYKTATFFSYTPIVEIVDNTLTPETGDTMEKIITVGDLKPGDGVRIATQNNEVSKVVKYFGCKSPGVSVNKTGSFDATSRILYGNVSKKRDKCIQLSGMDEVLNIDGTKIYIYENDMVKEGSMLDIASSEFVSSGSKIFAYLKAGTVKSLLIVK